jgi:NAD(P)H-dependent FMN reductase
MNILAISGSLRAASINSAFCRATARVAQEPLQICVFTGVGDLPLFNPDLESTPPSSVLEFRAAVGRANALVIASPEYAHGISGAMKNALDWLVSFEGFIHKPVAVINTSPRAQHAYASLIEILQTMSASILREASVTIPLLGTCVTEEAMLDSPEVSKKIQSTLEAIVASLSGTGESGPNFPLG